MLERTIARKQQQKIRLLNARISIAITNREYTYRQTKARRRKKTQKSAANYLCFDFFGHDCVFLERKDNKRLKLTTHKTNKNCIHFSVYCHTLTNITPVCVFRITFFRESFSQTPSCREFSFWVLCSAALCLNSRNEKKVLYIDKCI